MSKGLLFMIRRKELAWSSDVGRPRSPWHFTRSRDDATGN